ncbi:MAG: UvrD-helicase domain-containing protein [Eubacteriales bacterium]|nr:UvrD-helicase domain-containing protein [Eubacteriales bacterium]MDD4105997.1 UvrD-helicase domain-containing protein [Eubacteriales bacterium]
MTNWTAAQMAAIGARNRDILVSAAAGSGKTTVMIERVMSLLRSGASLERMLIVTFTRAAAGEMRDRLTRALAREAEDNLPLRDQYDRIGQAHISTLHTFCISVLRRHFQEAGADPLSRTADDNVTGALLDRALSEAVDAFYEEPDDDAQMLIDQFSDAAITDMARQLHSFLMAQAEPWEWLQKALQAPVSGDDIQRHPLYAVMRDSALLQLEGAIQYVSACDSVARGPGGPGRYLSNNEEDRAVVQSLMQSLLTTGLLPGAVGFKPGTLSRTKVPAEETQEAREEFKFLRAGFKNCVQAAGKLMPGSAEQLKEWADAIQATIPAQRALGALTRDVYDRYQALKAARAIWDYGDLEHQTLFALKSPEVARDVAGGFDFIFVDEYQDISRTQENIIRLIHQDNDLFMVGDVKQSIYRFRLADPGLFLTKYASFEEEKDAAERVIKLAENFRSRPNILSAVNEIFQTAMRSRVTEIAYDEAARLSAGRTGSGDAPVELHIIDRTAAPEIPSDEEEESEDTGAADESLSGAAQLEAALIARRIIALRGSMIEDGGRLREARLRDMVILLRSASSRAEQMARILRDHGISVYSDVDAQYFALPEIKDILNILAVLDNPYQDVPLLSTLSCPVFSFTPEQVGRIRAEAKDRHQPFWQAFMERENADEQVARALRKIRDWRFCAKNMDFETFMRMLVDESGLYARAGALPGGDMRRANLRLLCERARGATEKWTLESFLSGVKDARKRDKTSSAAALGEHDDVVRIMTIHKAKGLEFPIVFVADLAHGFRFGNLGDLLRCDSEAGLSLPQVDTVKRISVQTYAGRAIKEKKDRETRSEESRLLYVAMTRAKERLILTATPRTMKAARATWAIPTGDFAAGSASCMLDWIGGALWDALRDNESRLHTGECGATWQISWHHEDEFIAPGAAKHRAPLPQLHANPSETMMRRMRGREEESIPLKTSVTALLKRLPEEDDEEETPVIKRQEFKHELPPMPLPRLGEQTRLTAADKGSITHKALGIMPLDGLLDLSGDALEKQITQRLDELRSRGVLTNTERAAADAALPARFLEDDLGQRMLGAKDIMREQAFTLKAEGDVLLQGVMDLAFKEDGAWVLVDYKTDRETASILPKYRDQMRWYMRALRALTGESVKEAWLYALRSGTAVKVEESEEIRLTP